MNLANALETNSSLTALNIEGNDLSADAIERIDQLLSGREVPEVNPYLGIRVALPGAKRGRM